MLKISDDDSVHDPYDFAKANPAVTIQKAAYSWQEDPIWI